jgi:hypothetical protein
MASTILWLALAWSTMPLARNVRPQHQRLPSATVFGCHVHGCSGLNTAKVATRVAGFKQR